MIESKQPTYPLFLIKLLITMALLSAGQVRGEPDVLERPAMQSVWAESSALLAVTRAGNRIVAVGERGIVLLSDDNGLTWSQAVVPVSVTLTNVLFINDRTGWAIGHSGVVLQSTDGGQSWQMQLDGKKAAELSLAMAKEWVAQNPDDSKAKHLLNDAKRLVADGADKPFLDLWFRNESEGFVVGAYGLILGTTDGGKTWSSWQNRLDNPFGLHLYSIDMVDDDIYIAGELGTLYHSTDSGQDFTQVKTPYEGSFFGVLHLTGGGVLVFGLRGNAYRSLDGGSNWEQVSIADESLNAARHLDDGSIVLVDNGGRVWGSKDSASNFQPLLERQAYPLTGIVQAADGAIVLTGLGGVVRKRSFNVTPVTTQ